jgi:putative DNA primase/helicase
MDIKSFCDKNLFKYIAFTTDIIKDKNGKSKKIFKNLIDNWKTKTIEELKKINDNNKNFTHYLINMNNDFIVFDTDDEESYNILVEFLRKNNLYDEQSITVSTRGNEYFFKRHFWFKTKDETFKNLKKHKLNNTEVFISSNCFISESKNSTLKIKNYMDSNMYEEIKTIFTKKNLNIENIIENKTVNIDERINNEQQYNTNENLKFIMDYLAPQRFIDYNDWIKIYWVFINENFSLDLFEYYSKKHYPAYNKEENLKLLKNAKINKDGFKIATLYHFLKQDNIKVFNELQKTRVDFWEIFSDLKNHIQPANLFYQTYPHLYIKSTSTGWYEYNENNILIHRGPNFPSSMLNNITILFQSLLIEQRNLVLPKSKKDADYNEKMKMFYNAYNKIGMTNFVNNVKEYLTHLYTVENIDDLIDSNVNIIAFDNMLYDNTIKNFRNIKPTDYISKTTKYSINTKSNPIIKEKLINLLRSMFETDEIYNYHLKTIALSLFGNINETFIINSGRGRNGKGICGQLIEKALGSYFYSGESTFYTTVYRADRPNSTLYNLKGIRYFLTTEPEADSETKFNVGLIKKTTGNDTITVRDLNKSNISYKPQFTPFLQCNNKPKIDSVDEAVKNRFRIINFPYTFVQEPNKPNEKKIDITIKDSLNQDMYNEFMLLLLEINKTMEKNIIVPREVMGNVDEYLNANNDVKQWVESVFEINDNKKDCFTSVELLTEFNNVGDYAQLNAKKFNEYMKVNNIPSKLVKGVKYYYGLKRKEVLEDEQDFNELD